ncbi:MAG: Flavin-dependent oxidoreductase, luciferase family [Chloroflexi bacterium]|jgi:FMN-dependent oxidoreductase (nitrilotriacetate monooxygenase family)|nr:MAG: Flavin-dependent oxidoreductase, luciferase family [Chloroflexota bacterium]
MRQMKLVAFLQAQNCTTLPSSWRHPEARIDTYSPDYYQHIARVLEKGKFDIGFFDDRLAMPDMYAGDHSETVKNGIRCTKLDAVTCLMSMAAVTEHLGLGATYSTTYYEPFHVARLFQTLDLMTKGRAAWNVVTSVNDNEARNMGREAHLEHDTRYDRADEFCEAVLGHWDSWDDDAIVVDKENNLYAHPDKVRKIDFKGKYLNSRGPFTVPRTPQGRPVIIQAGGSTRGKQFAARWGELIFAGYQNADVGKVEYAALKKDAEEAGRNPDDMKIASLMYPIAAATKSEAEDKKAAYELLSNDMDQLLLLSEALNFDFSTKGMDEGFTEEELEGLQGMQAMRDRVVSSGVINPTPRDFMRITRRGLLSDGHTMVGGPKDIADEMEEWFHSLACDGFVVGPTHQPGAFEDFVEFVVPELQKRGVFRKEYSGNTLRDHLGLDRAAIGSWKTNYDTVPM